MKIKDKKNSEESESYDEDYAKWENNVASSSFCNNEFKTSFEPKDTEKNSNIFNGFTTAAQFSKINGYKSEDLSVKMGQMNFIKEKENNNSSASSSNDSSSFVGFKTAGEIVKMNKDVKRDELRKKINSRAITDFFKNDDKINKKKRDNNNLEKKSITDVDYFKKCEDDMKTNEAKKRYEVKKPVKSKQSSAISKKNFLLFGDDDSSPERDNNNYNNSSEKIIESNVNANGCEQKLQAVVINKSNKQNLQPGKILAQKRTHTDSQEIKSPLNSKRQKLTNVEQISESVKMHRKTFYILKPFVKEYYVSHYIPSAEKFKSIFKKIHMDVLNKKLIGKFYKFIL